MSKYKKLTVDELVQICIDKERKLDSYRNMVVWGFYEEKTPMFYQGISGENEICDPVTADMVNAMFKENQRLNRKVASLNRQIKRLKSA
jgi:hypothetical protein